MGRAWLDRVFLKDAGPQATQRYVQPVEALRVSNQEIPFGDQEAAELSHQLLLRGAVEIYHDVAAEYHLEGLRMIVGFNQVDLPESDPFGNARFDAAGAFPAPVSLLEVS